MILIIVINIMLVWILWIKNVEILECYWERFDDLIDGVIFVKKKVNVCKMVELYDIFILK